MRPIGAIAAATLLCCSALWMACGGTPETEIQNPAPMTYEMRGVVRQVRNLGEGGTQISVQHEAIPDFVGINGDRIGMKSMTMPFAVADSVDVSSLEPGAKVKFELSVDWNRREPGLVTALMPLPADTILDFDNTD